MLDMLVGGGGLSLEGFEGMESGMAMGGQLRVGVQECRTRERAGGVLGAWCLLVPCMAVVLMVHG